MSQPRYPHYLLEAKKQSTTTMALLEIDVKDTKDTKKNDVSENTSPSPSYKEVLLGRVKGKDG